MNGTYKFEQDPDKRWYIVLPSWEGERAELEMVEGADDLLTQLAKGKKTIRLELTVVDDITHPTQTPFLSLDVEGGKGSGAWYFYFGTQNAQNNILEHVAKYIWLCDVTKFVFDGYFPKFITVKRVEE